MVSTTSCFVLSSKKHALDIYVFSQCSTKNSVNFTRPKKKCEMSYIIHYLLEAYKKSDCRNENTDSTEQSEEEEDLILKKDHVVYNPHQQPVVAYEIFFWDRLSPSSPFLGTILIGILMVG